MGCERVGIAAPRQGVAWLTVRLSSAAMTPLMNCSALPLKVKPAGNFFKSRYGASE